MNTEYIYSRKENNFLIMTAEGRAENGVYPEEAGLIKEFLQDESGDIMALPVVAFQGPLVASDQLQEHLANLLAFLMGLENDSTLFVDRFQCWGAGNEWTALVTGVEVSPGAVQ